MENSDTRNLILAMVLSLLVLFGWNYFFGPDPSEIAPTETSETQSATDAESLLTENDTTLSREEAIAASPRVIIETPRVGGSIALTGGVLDDLQLHDYHEDLDPSSPDVKMLQPKGSGSAYYTQIGFTAGAGTDGAHVPTLSTEWSVKSGDQLTPTTPVVLTWTSPSGVTYDREYQIDENFMFTITETISNASSADITIQPVGLISLTGTPESQGTFVLHEGQITDIDGETGELTFKNMRKGNSSQADPHLFKSRQDAESFGWLGLTTKYWMTTIIPETGTFDEVTTIYNETTDTYTLGSYQAPMTIAAGQTATTSNRIYSGAKEVGIIRDYRDNLGIDRFDDTVDWGWFSIFTKPFFSALHWLYKTIGNMGLAIIALTFCIKAILFPLAYKSYSSMGKMKKLQPQMEKLKEAAGDDKVKLQQGMMELYKREKVNPVAGCLPMLVQIPIFFALYKVLYVTTELRHAPFFGPWKDLSAPDPTSIMNLFGLLPWGAPEPGTMLATALIGILPILLGISMWLTQKLNPTPQDDTQKMIFAWMPWVFMFMMGGFATGLVVYWITNNVLTFVQQYTIMRSQGAEINLLGNILGKKKA